MATLRSTDTFDKIRVYVVFSDRRIRSYLALRNRDRIGVGGIPSIGRNYSTYDTTSEAFITARDAVNAGTAVIEYRILFTGGSYVTYLDSALPPELEIVREWDPLQKSITALSQTSPDIGPTDKIFYKYETPVEGTDLAAPIPNFQGDVDGLTTHMATLGWYITTNLAYDNRGTHTNLFHTLVTYYFNGTTGVSDSSASAPITSGVQYSTDYGQTWSSDRPTDYSDVTDIQVLIGSQWVDFLIRSEVEIVSPVEFLLNEIFPPYTSGLPYTVNIAEDAIGEMYGLQIYAEKAKSWTEARISLYGNVTELLPLNTLKLLSPHLYGWSAATGGYITDDWQSPDGRYALSIHKRTGEVEIAHIDHDDLQSIFPNSDYHSYIVAFERYPSTELHGPVESYEVSMYLYGSSYGLQPGDLIWIEDEQIRLVSLLSEGRSGMGDLPPEDEYVISDWIVVRGVGGTQAASHARFTPVSGILRNPGDKIRRLTFFEGNGLSRPTRVRLLGFRNYREVSS